jgi:hypothetical protein
VTNVPFVFKLHMRLDLTGATPARNVLADVITYNRSWLCSCVLSSRFRTSSTVGENLERTVVMEGAVGVLGVAFAVGSSAAVSEIYKYEYLGDRYDVVSEPR